MPKIVVESLYNIRVPPLLKAGAMPNDHKQKDKGFQPQNWLNMQLSKHPLGNEAKAT